MTDYFRDGVGYLQISIHTSTREVTEENGIVICDTQISIHTSTREVTARNCNVEVDTNISIHTSTREVTIYIKSTDKDTLISIHTSTREVTLAGTTILVLAKNFNPHFHKGSDNVALKASGKF